MPEIYEPTWWSCPMSTIHQESFVPFSIQGPAKHVPYNRQIMSNVILFNHQKGLPFASHNSQCYIIPGNSLKPKPLDPCALHLDCLPPQWYSNCRRLRLLLWFLHKNVMLTKDNLVKRRWQKIKNVVVVLKNNNKETIQPPFFDCHVARYWWLNLIGTGTFGLRMGMSEFAVYHDSCLGSGIEPKSSSYHSKLPT